MSSYSSRILPTMRADRVHRREVDLLGHRALAQRQHAAVEQLLRPLLVERRVVVDLAHASRDRPSVASLVVVAHLVQHGVVVVVELGVAARPTTATRRRSP